MTATTSDTTRRSDDHDNRVTPLSGTQLHQHLVGMDVAPKKVYTLDLNAADEASRALLERMEALGDAQDSNDMARSVKAIAEAQRAQASDDQLRLRQTPADID